MLYLRQYLKVSSETLIQYGPYMINVKSKTSSQKSTLVPTIYEKTHLGIGKKYFLLESKSSKRAKT